MSRITIEQAIKLNKSLAEELSQSEIKNEEMQRLIDYHNDMADWLDELIKLRA